MDLEQKERVMASSGTFLNLIGTSVVKIKSDRVRGYHSDEDPFFSSSLWTQPFGVLDTVVSNWVCAEFQSLSFVHSSDIY